MHGRFPYLSAFGKKVLEVCGAGLTSAVVACLVGQTDKPASPLAPVVYLSPADAQMLKLMHHDQAALIDQLRSEPEKPAPAVAPVDTPAAQPVAPTLLPPQSASAAPNRRESKPNHAPAIVTAKRRSEEPAPVASATAGNPPSIALTSSPAPLSREIEPQDLTVHAVINEAGDWMASLKQIPGWFWPAGGGLVSAAPRPPMPVGNLVQHMM